MYFVFPPFVFAGQEPKAPPVKAELGQSSAAAAPTASPTGVRGVVEKTGEKRDRWANDPNSETSRSNRKKALSEVSVAAWQLSFLLNHAKDKKLSWLKEQLRFSEYYAGFAPAEHCSDPNPMQTPLDVDDLKVDYIEFLDKEVIARAQNAVEALLKWSATNYPDHFGTVEGNYVDEIDVNLATVKASGMTCTLQSRKPQFSGLSETAELPSRLVEQIQTWMDKDNQPFFALLATDRKGPVSNVEIRAWLAWILTMRDFRNLLADYFKVRRDQPVRTAPLFSFDGFTGQRVKLVLEGIREASAEKQLAEKIIRAAVERSAIPKVEVGKDGRYYVSDWEKDKSARVNEEFVMAGHAPKDPQEDHYLDLDRKFQVWKFMEQREVLKTMLQDKSLDYPQACLGEEYKSYREAYAEMAEGNRRLQWGQEFQKVLGMYMDEVVQGKQTLPIPTFDDSKALFADAETLAHEFVKEFYETYAPVPEAKAEEKKEMPDGLDAFAGYKKPKHPSEARRELVFAAMEEFPFRLRAEEGNRGELLQGDRPVLDGLLDTAHNYRMLRGMDYSTRLTDKLRLFAGFAKDDLSRLDLEQRKKVLTPLMEHVVLFTMVEALEAYLLSFSYDMDASPKDAIDLWETNYKSRWAMKLRTQYADRISAITEKLVSTLLAYPELNKELDTEAFADAQIGEYAENVSTQVEKAAEADDTYKFMQYLVSDWKTSPLPSGNLLPGPWNYHWQTSGAPYEWSLTSSNTFDGRHGLLNPMAWQRFFMTRDHGFSTKWPTYFQFWKDGGRDYGYTLTRLNPMEREDYLHVKPAYAAVAERVRDKFIEILKAAPYNYTDENIQRAYGMKLGALVDLVLRKYSETLEAEDKADRGRTWEDKLAIYSSVQRWLANPMARYEYETHAVDQANRIYDQYLQNILEGSKEELASRASTLQTELDYIRVHEMENIHMPDAKYVINLSTRHNVFDGFRKEVKAIHDETSSMDLFRNASAKLKELCGSAASPDNRKKCGEWSRKVVAPYAAENDAKLRELFLWRVVNSTQIYLQQFLTHYSYGQPEYTGMPKKKDGETEEQYLLRLSSPADVIRETMMDSWFGFVGKKFEPKKVDPKDPKAKEVEEQNKKMAQEQVPLAPIVDEEEEKQVKQFQSAIDSILVEASKKAHKSKLQPGAIEAFVYAFRPAIVTHVRANKVWEAWRANVEKRLAVIDSIANPETADETIQNFAAIAHNLVQYQLLKLLEPEQSSSWLFGRSPYQVALIIGLMPRFDVFAAGVQDSLQYILSPQPDALKEFNATSEAIRTLQDDRLLVDSERARFLAWGWLPLDWLSLESPEQKKAMIDYQVKQLKSLQEMAKTRLVNGEARLRRLLETFASTVPQVEETLIRLAAKRDEDEKMRAAEEERRQKAGRGYLVEEVTRPEAEHLMTNLFMKRIALSYKDASGQDMKLTLSDVLNDISELGLVTLKQLPFDPAQAMAYLKNVREYVELSKDDRFKPEFEKDYQLSLAISLSRAMTAPNIDALRRLSPRGLSVFRGFAERMQRLHAMKAKNTGAVEKFKENVFKAYNYAAGVKFRVDRFVNGVLESMYVSKVNSDAERERKAREEHAKGPDKDFPFGLDVFAGGAIGLAQAQQLEAIEKARQAAAAAEKRRADDEPKTAADKAFPKGLDVFVGGAEGLAKDAENARREFYRKLLWNPVTSSFLPTGEESFNEILKRIGELEVKVGAQLGSETEAPKELVSEYWDLVQLTSDVLHANDETFQPKVTGDGRAVWLSVPPTADVPPALDFTGLAEAKTREELQERMQLQYGRQADPGAVVKALVAIAKLPELSGKAFKAYFEKAGFSAPESDRVEDRLNWIEKLSTEDRAKAYKAAKAKWEESLFITKKNLEDVPFKTGKREGLAYQKWLEMLVMFDRAINDLKFEEKKDAVEIAMENGVHERFEYAGFKELAKSMYALFVDYSPFRFNFQSMRLEVPAQRVNADESKALFAEADPRVQLRVIRDIRNLIKYEIQQSQMKGMASFAQLLGRASKLGVSTAHIGHVIDLPLEDRFIEESQKYPKDPRKAQEISVAEQAFTFYYENLADYASQEQQLQRATMEGWRRHYRNRLRLGQRCDTSGVSTFEMDAGLKGTKTNYSLRFVNWWNTIKENPKAHERFTELRRGTVAPMIAEGGRERRHIWNLYSGLEEFEKGKANESNLFQQIAGLLLVHDDNNKASPIEGTVQYLTALFQYNFDKGKVPPLPIGNVEKVPVTEFHLAKLMEPLVNLIGHNMVDFTDWQAPFRKHQDPSDFLTIAGSMRDHFVGTGVNRFLSTNIDSQFTVNPIGFGANWNYRPVPLVDEENERQAFSPKVDFNEYWKRLEDPRNYAGYRAMADDDSEHPLFAEMAVGKREIIGEGDLAKQPGSRYQDPDDSIKADRQTGLKVPERRTVDPSQDPAAHDNYQRGRQNWNEFFSAAAMTKPDPKKISRIVDKLSLSGVLSAKTLAERKAIQAKMLTYFNHDPKKLEEMIAALGIFRQPSPELSVAEKESFVNELKGYLPHVDSDVLKRMLSDLGLRRGYSPQNAAEKEALREEVVSYFQLRETLVRFRRTMAELNRKYRFESLHLMQGRGNDLGNTNIDIDINIDLKLEQNKLDLSLTADLNEALRAFRESLKRFEQFDAPGTPGKIGIPRTTVLKRPDDFIDGKVSEVPEGLPLVPFLQPSDTRRFVVAQASYEASRLVHDMAFADLDDSQRTVVQSKIGAIDDIYSVEHQKRLVRTGLYRAYDNVNEQLHLLCSANFKGKTLAQSDPLMVQTNLAYMKGTEDLLFLKSGITPKIEVVENVRHYLDEILSRQQTGEKIAANMERITINVILGFATLYTVGRMTGHVDKLLKTAGESLRTRLTIAALSGMLGAEFIAVDGLAFHNDFFAQPALIARLVRLRDSHFLGADPAMDGRGAAAVAEMQLGNFYARRSIAMTMLRVWGMTMGWGMMRPGLKMLRGGWPYLAGRMHERVPVIRRVIPSPKAIADGRASRTVGLLDLSKTRDPFAAMEAVTGEEALERTTQAVSTATGSKVLPENTLRVTDKFAGALQKDAEAQLRDIARIHGLDPATGGPVFRDGLQFGLPPNHLVGGREHVRGRISTLRKFIDALKSGEREFKTVDLLAISVEGDPVVRHTNWVMFLMGVPNRFSYTVRTMSKMRSLAYAYADVLAVHSPEIFFTLGQLHMRGYLMRPTETWMLFNPYTAPRIKIPGKVSTLLEGFHNDLIEAAGRELGQGASAEDSLVYIVQGFDRLRTGNARSAREVGQVVQKYLPLLQAQSEGATVMASYLDAYMAKKGLLIEKEATRRLEVLNQFVNWIHQAREDVAVEMAQTGKSRREVLFDFATSKDSRFILTEAEAVKLEEAFDPRTSGVGVEYAGESKRSLAEQAHRLRQILNSAGEFTTTAGKDIPLSLDTRLIDAVANEDYQLIARLMTGTSSVSADDAAVGPFGDGQHAKENMWEEAFEELKLGEPSKKPEVHVTRPSGRRQTPAEIPWTEDRVILEVKFGANGPVITTDMSTRQLVAGEFERLAQAGPVVGNEAFIGQLNSAKTSSAIRGKVWDILENNFTSLDLTRVMKSLQEKGLMTAQLKRSYDQAWLYTRALERSLEGDAAELGTRFDNWYKMYVGLVRDLGVAPQHAEQIFTTLYSRNGSVWRMDEIRHVLGIEGTSNKRSVFRRLQLIRNNFEVFRTRMPNGINHERAFSNLQKIAGLGSLKPVDAVVKKGIARLERNLLPGVNRVAMDVEGTKFLDEMVKHYSSAEGDLFEAGANFDSYRAQLIREIGSGALPFERLELINRFSFWVDSTSRLRIAQAQGAITEDEVKTVTEALLADLEHQKIRFPMRTRDHATFLQSAFTSFRGADGQLVNPYLSESVFYNSTKLQELRASLIKQKGLIDKGEGAITEEVWMRLAESADALVRATSRPGSIEAELMEAGSGSFEFLFHPSVVNNQRVYYGLLGEPSKMATYWRVLMAEEVLGETGADLAEREFRQKVLREISYSRERHQIFMDLMDRLPWQNKTGPANEIFRISRALDRLGVADDLIRQAETITEAVDVAFAAADADQLHMATTYLRRAGVADDTVEYITGKVAYINNIPEFKAGGSLRGSPTRPGRARVNVGGF